MSNLGLLLPKLTEREAYLLWFIYRWRDKKDSHYLPGWDQCKGTNLKVDLILVNANQIFEEVNIFPVTDHWGHTLKTLRNKMDKYISENYWKNNGSSLVLK